MVFLEKEKQWGYTWRDNRRYVGEKCWKCFVIGGLYLIVLYSLIIFIYMYICICVYMGTCVYVGIYIYMFFFCNLLTVACECIRAFMLKVCVFVTFCYIELKAIKVFKKG